MHCLGVCPPPRFFPVPQFLSFLFPPPPDVSPSTYFGMPAAEPSAVGRKVSGHRKFRQKKECAKKANVEYGWVSKVLYANFWRRRDREGLRREGWSVEASREWDGGGQRRGKSFQSGFCLSCAGISLRKGKRRDRGEARALEQEEIQQRLREGRERAKMGQMGRTRGEEGGDTEKDKKEGCKTLCKTKETKNKMQVCKRGPKSDFPSDTFQRVLVRGKGKGDLPPPAFFSFRTLFRRLKEGRKGGRGKRFFSRYV